MTPDEQKQKMETAEKLTIIESRIILPIDKLGGEVSDERKAGLKRMRKSELLRLADGVQNTNTPRKAIGMVVTAICDSDAARRSEEYEDDRKSDEHVGPARMDMNL